MTHPIINTTAAFQRAIRDADIERIPHHACAICTYVVAFVVSGQFVYFDPGCDCIAGTSPLLPVEWEEVLRFVRSKDDPIKFLKDLGVEVSQ